MTTHEFSLTPMTKYDDKNGYESHTKGPRSNNVLRQVCDTVTLFAGKDRADCTGGCGEFGGESRPNNLRLGICKNTAKNLTTTGISRNFRRGNSFHSSQKINFQKFSGIPIGIQSFSGYNKYIAIGNSPNQKTARQSASNTRTSLTPNLKPVDLVLSENITRIGNLSIASTQQRKNFRRKMRES